MLSGYAYRDCFKIRISTLNMFYLQCLVVDMFHPNNFFKDTEYMEVKPDEVENDVKLGDVKDDVKLVDI